jgi:hypothetical protein
MQQKTCVPVDCYDNVLITEERSPLEQGSGHKRKYYAPGVGNVRVGAVGDAEALVLAEVSHLSPDDLAKVRQEALKLEKTAYEISAIYSQTSPTVLTTEPQPEPPSPEPPQPTTTRPSIEIANAPIGGDDGEGPRGCAKVNWLGTKPIPDGITIKLESIRLDSKGIFKLDQDSCSGKAPSCAGLEWKGGNPHACYVGAKQVAFVDTNKEDVEVHVIAAVTVTCKRQADCDSLAADPKNSDGSSVGFTPGANFGKPSEEQSEPPSDEQSEPPSDEQSEPPSDEKSEPPSDEKSEAKSESLSNG